MSGTHEEFGAFVSVIREKETIDKINLESLKVRLKQEDFRRTCENEKLGKERCRVRFAKIL